MFAATALLVLAAGVKCKRKFDGDFEFAEEVSQSFVTAKSASSSLLVFVLSYFFPATCHAKDYEGQQIASSFLPTHEGTTHDNG
jgi:hypothetical protein